MTWFTGLRHAALSATPAEALERARAVREALEFYADPETYFAIGFFPNPPNGDFMDDFEELEGELGHPDGSTWVKPGKRARAALARLDLSTVAPAKADAGGEEG